MGIAGTVVSILRICALLALDFRIGAFVALDALDVFEVVDDAGDGDLIALVCDGVLSAGFGMADETVGDNASAAAAKGIAVSAKGSAMCRAGGERLDAKGCLNRLWLGFRRDPVAGGGGGAGGDDGGLCSRSPSLDRRGAALTSVWPGTFGAVASGADAELTLFDLAAIQLLRSADPGRPGGCLKPTMGESMPSDERVADEVLCLIGSNSGVGGAIDPADELSECIEARGRGVVNGDVGGARWSGPALPLFRREGTSNVMSKSSSSDDEGSSIMIGEYFDVRGEGRTEPCRPCISFVCLT